MRDDEIRKFIKDFLDKVSKIVQKVENKFIERRCF